MSVPKVTARRTQLTLRTYTRQPRRRLPLIFQETYGNIYPDTRDDVLGGPVKNLKYDAIVLENSHIRVTILPDMGGKIWSVYDKHARRETLHVPDCVKPGMVFVCGAWIAGGMEINFPIGHHVDTMNAVPARILEQGPDCAVAVVERLCRRTGLRMVTRTTLRAGQACFDLSMTVTNPTSLSQRWYQWTNVGVTAGMDWRFSSKGNLYTGGMGIDTYPVSKNGKDISWYKNRAVAGDNFMVGLREDFFGCYDFAKEHGLAHWAPWQQLPGKKYFTWGSTQRSYDSGRILNDTGDDYIEIQTGPMETQSHFAMIEPGQTVSFGGTWMPYRRIGGLEWACRELLFNVRDGVPWVYATADVKAEITIGRNHHAVRLTAGQTRRLPGRVRAGTQVAITVNGKQLRRFEYPLKGRMEPKALARCLAEQDLFTAASKTKPAGSAAHLLSVGRQLVKWDFGHRALKAFRAALEQKPAFHEARLDLAAALFRMGDFAAGEDELNALRRTPFAARAQELLARRPQMEREWLAPVLAQPAGAKRDLALAERYAGYGAFELAERLYRKLLRTDARNPRVQFGQAMYLWHVKKDLKRAVEHAGAGLARMPGDRDLLIELIPLYMQAGLHEEAIKQIGKASPAVRKLAILAKPLARAYFETGQFARAWKILTTMRLHNWEGEFEHVETYIECGLALAEQSLAKGDLSAARRYVEMAADPSKAPALGVLRDCGGTERVQFWTSMVILHEGKRAQAEEIWRQAAGPVAALKKLPLDISEWHIPPRPENEYLRVMCAVALGDTKLARHATNLLQRMRNEWAAGVDTYAVPVDLMDGMVAELRGEFAKAARFFQRHIATAPDKQIARLHLAAVQAGRMRGAPLPACKTDR
jgi:hypothetical protein